MNFSSLLRELEMQPESIQEQKEVETTSYILIDDLDPLKELVAYLSLQPTICVDTETTGTHPLHAELVGIGLGIEPLKAWYIPVNGKLPKELVLDTLKPFFEHPQIGFYGHHQSMIIMSYIMRGSNWLIFALTPCWLPICSIHIAGSTPSIILALELFGKVKIPIQELIGKGKSQISMRDVPIEKVCSYCCEDVDYTVRLKEALAPRLKKEDSLHYFTRFRTSFLPILAKMETQWDLYSMALSETTIP